MRIEAAMSLLALLAEGDDAAAVETEAGPAVTPATEHPRDPAPTKLTAADVESFRRMGVSVCIKTESAGVIWLVPEKTGRYPNEMTPEDVIDLDRVMDDFKATFPDAPHRFIDFVPAPGGSSSNTAVELGCQVDFEKK